MVTINYAFREVVCKIVYYGPGLSGKTTNLQYVFNKVPAQARGELISLATESDRTLYFDFLPINLGSIQGLATKFQLYTVPGQVFYNATRKMVLRGVDGLVFVADSQLAKMDENMESLNNLKENLSEYGYSFEDIPLVIQYNKSDIPLIAPIDHLQSLLNTRNVPYFKAIAVKGVGVFDTLKAICKIVLDKSRQESGGSEAEKVSQDILPSGSQSIPEAQATGHWKAAIAVQGNESTSFQPEVTIVDHSQGDLENFRGSHGSHQADDSDGVFRPIKSPPPGGADNITNGLELEANEPRSSAISERPSIAESVDLSGLSKESVSKPFLPGFEMNMDKDITGGSVRADVSANTAIESVGQDQSRIEEDDYKRILGKAAKAGSLDVPMPEAGKSSADSDTAWIEIKADTQKASLSGKEGESSSSSYPERENLGIEGSYRPTTMQKPRMQGMTRVKKTKKLSLFGWIKSLGQKQGGD